MYSTCTCNTFAIEVFVSDGFFIVQAPTRTALFERLEKLYGKYLLHYFKNSFYCIFKFYAENGHLTHTVDS